MPAYERMGTIILWAIFQETKTMLVLFLMLREMLNLEDSKAAGWDRKNQFNSVTAAYDKLIQLNAFNLTIPGYPVLYYGDEIGNPGLMTLIVADSCVLVIS